MLVCLHASLRPARPSAAKLTAGEELCKDNKVGALNEHANGKIDATVQGSEPYSVTAVLLDDGLWDTTTCSCPDGTRTGGKCKHVAAVLLKAAMPQGGSTTASAGNVQANSSAVVELDDDDDVEELTPAGAPQQPPRAKRAPAEPESKPLQDPGSAKGNEAPSSSPQANARPAASARKLPAWLSAPPAGKKPAAGASAAARAAAKLAKDSHGKRKAQTGEGSGSGDDAGEDGAQVNKAPGARKPTREPPNKRKRESAARLGGSARGKATDFVPDDMGIDFIMELAGGGASNEAVGEVPKVQALRLCDTLPQNGKRSVEMTAKKSEDDCMQAGGQLRSKERVLSCHASEGDDTRLPGVAAYCRSKQSSQSSSVPDTPERCSPGDQTPGTGPMADALGQPSAKATGLAVDTDSSSDSDEDPQEKFARKFQEKLRGGRSQQNSQTSAPATAGTTAPGSMGSDKKGNAGQRAAGDGMAQSPTGALKDAKPSKKAASVALPAAVNDDDDMTLGRLSQTRPLARGNLTAQGIPSGAEPSEASPPTRPRPTASTHLSNKPTMSLAERMKQLRES